MLILLVQMDLSLSGCNITIKDPDNIAVVDNQEMTGLNNFTYTTDVTLSKAGYFKYLAPWWKNALVKAGIATGVAGLLVGAIGSYPFAGFIKEEALQTLGFAVLAANKK